jgi:hypothetical protein
MIGAFASAPLHEGTRFRLFPQAPYRTATPPEPETVWLSPRPGSIGPGPQDDRIYVVDPVGKWNPYGIAFTPYGTPYLYLPPWDRPIYPPAMASPDGHFDHLEVGTTEFEMAHVYGCVRFVLDVWERYFGRPIEWHFSPRYERLEILLLPTWDNAHVGWGFMEVGAHTTAAGEHRPFSLNFDTIAHELGHLIIYSEVGIPPIDGVGNEYFGFHEAAADLTALIAVLQFHSVVSRLLEMTRGNLYTFNELNRFAELGENEQIRIAGSDITLSAFAAGWVDEHDLSKPLTGALFDIFVDIFHESLLERGLISPEVEDLADQVQYVPEYEPLIQAFFDDAYAANPRGFEQALLDARDDLGRALAETWRRLPLDSLNYADVAAVLLDVDRDLTGGRYQRLIRSNFLWREIGVVRVGPRLSPPGPDSHALSARTVMPDSLLAGRRLSYRERWEMARRTGLPFESMGMTARFDGVSPEVKIAIESTRPSDGAKPKPPSTPLPK